VGGWGGETEGGLEARGLLSGCDLFCTEWREGEAAEGVEEG